MFLLLLIIVLFLWLEIAVTSLPIFLIAVLVMFVLYPVKHNNLVFVLAFLGGLVLDASAVRYLGGASLFLTCWLFLILLYERKYEIDTIPFVLVSSFFGIFLYLWFFGYGDILMQSVAGSFFSCVLFVIFKCNTILREDKLQFDDLTPTLS